jgi:hypothetical protein
VRRGVVRAFGTSLQVVGPREGSASLLGARMIGPIPPMPILIINPLGDTEFATLVRDLTRGAETPAVLQASLRGRDPATVVRSRGLDGLSDAWYVYREGRWVG